jgi:HSP20 family protein
VSEAPEDTFELINALIRRLMEHEEPGRTIACGFRIGVKGVGNSQAGEEGIDPPDEEVETIGMNMEPTVEIYTTDDDVTVAADLPGFEGHEIRLLFINGTLTIIAGESQVASIDLPPVDPDSMESRYRHGVLEVRFSRGRPIRID